MLARLAPLNGKCRAPCRVDCVRQDYGPLKELHGLFARPYDEQPEMETRSVRRNRVPDYYRKAPVTP